MGFFGLFGKAKSRFRGPPVTLEDWQNWNGRRVQNLNVSSDEVKSCDTGKPRSRHGYVVTDERQDQHVLYTESLITCLGVLIHGNSFKGEVAALFHLLGGRMQEVEMVLEVVEEIEEEYHPEKLYVDIVVGDEPDPELFGNLVKALNKFPNIDSSSFDIIYPASKKPFFEGQHGTANVSAKIAYDVKKHSRYIGYDQ